MNQSNMLKHYVVDADPKTGEWIGEPEETGAEVQATEWAKKQDTSDEHYDRYEHNGETRAITLRWKGQFTEVPVASFEALKASIRAQLLPASNRLSTQEIDYIINAITNDLRRQRMFDMFDNCIASFYVEITPGNVGDWLHGAWLHGVYQGVVTLPSSRMVHYTVRQPKQEPDMEANKPATPQTPVAERVSADPLRMITHNHNGQYMKLSETLEGSFILLTQNAQGASAFEFNAGTPDYVKGALRNLQVAMERSNTEGNGGGVNNRMPFPMRAALAKAQG